MCTAAWLETTLAAACCMVATARRAWAAAECGKFPVAQGWSDADQTLSGWPQDQLSLNSRSTEPCRLPDKRSTNHPHRCAGKRGNVSSSCPTSFAQNSSRISDAYRYIISSGYFTTSRWLIRALVKETATKFGMVLRRASGASELSNNSWNLQCLTFSVCISLIRLLYCPRT